jgi:predicted dithiol-disulfide oxidoreductase (DUF899 family)
LRRLPKSINFLDGIFRKLLFPKKYKYLESEAKIDGIHEVTMATTFPGESSNYREVRDKLMEAEIQLRKQIESVAELRRQLPLGGRIPEDYAFEDDAGPVRLSQLFKAGQPSLIIYNFMYGPAMPQPCPMCTSILDGLNGTAPHVMDRVTLAVVAKSPMPRIRDFARQRGWNNLRLVSSASNSYNLDYHGEQKDGAQWPMLNVFVKRGDAIHHFYGTEMLYAPAEPGQDPRHVDLIWPLWNLFDMIPEGRGTKWHPKLRYDTLASLG